jgi:hypothetical protein
MDIGFYRYINKNLKVFDIPFYLLIFCAGILITTVLLSDTIILMFGRPDIPVINIIYGIIILILAIGRYLDDKYFNELYLQNLLLKNKRTKEIKTPRL